MMNVENKKNQNRKKKYKTLKIKKELHEIDFDVPTENNQKKSKILSHCNLFFVFGSFLIITIVCFIGDYFLFFPKIILNGEQNMTIVYPNVYQEPGAYLTRFGKRIDGSPDMNGTFDSTKLGNYKVKYSYREFFFQRTVTRQVSIVDNEKPVLTLNGTKELTICPGKTYQEEGYTAIDNYDGDITQKVTSSKTDTGIRYQVADSSGNEIFLDRIIHEQDFDAPVLKLKGNTTQYQMVGMAYSEAGYTATDGCDGDITNQVKVSGTVNVNQPGTYKLTYSVTDISGNTTSIDRTVIVTNTTDSGKKGVIYLTFDDGPHATNTAKILDVLKKYQVKATFFVTMSGPDSLILREHQEGHTVALHTASHNYQTVYSSVPNYFNDLQMISDRVKRITGVESKIIRFPGGSSNTISRRYQKGIMTTLTQEVLNRGYHYFDWNISSGDAGETTSSQGVYQNVIRSLRKDRANVVLMHDIKSYTANAVESIVQYGLANGYSFEAITMDTPMVRQRVNN